MIDPRALSTAAAMTLLLSTLAPTAGLAQYRDNGGNVGATTYRPPMTAYRPGPAVVAAPAAGGSRLVQPGAVYRGPAGGIYYNGANGGFRRPDRDGDRERRAFAAGAVTGAILGGSQGFGYYDGTPAVYPPGYSDGGPAIVPGPAAADAIAYCMQTYSSYDPRSGTYIGDDGNPHPCPP
jgi:hypothetical protein